MYRVIFSNQNHLIVICTPKVSTAAIGNRFFCIILVIEPGKRISGGVRLMPRTFTRILTDDKTLRDAERTIRKFEDDHSRTQRAVKMLEDRKLRQTIQSKEEELGQKDEIIIR